MLHLLFHMNSAKARAMASGSLLSQPIPRWRCLFTWNQHPSMVFVWAPVAGFTKFLEWLTSSWWYPWRSRFTYPFHPSEIMMVPGRTCCLMMRIRVWWSLWLFWHSTRKQSLLPRSTPPSSHFPFTSRLRLYLRFPARDSSTSTILPGPPMRGGVRSRSSTIYLPWQRVIKMAYVRRMSTVYPQV